MKEAQQEKITSLSTELQSTNEALNDLSLAKETAVKEKVNILVHHLNVSSTVMLSSNDECLQPTRFVLIQRPEITWRGLGNTVCIFSSSVYQYKV